MIMMSNVASAADITMSKAVMQFSNSYQTMDEAAKAGLDEIDKMCGKQCDKEYAGVILFENGMYYLTNLVTNNNGSEVGMFSILKTPKSKIVAAFHDHPNVPLSEVFSGADIYFSNHQHWICYVGMYATHKIMRFTPGITHTESVKNIDPILVGDNVSEGDYVAPFANY